MNKSKVEIETICFIKIPKNYQDLLKLDFQTIVLLCGFSINIIQNLNVF